MELAHTLEVNHTRAQLSPACQQCVQEALDISVLQPVPAYAGKSFKQKSIDLVHPLLNAMHSYWYTELGWSKEVKLRDIVGVSEGMGERLDFARKLPNDKWVAIEIQFGNGGRLEKDFSKMRELHNRGLLELGVLIYFTQETADTADSGLATYEKALQYKHLFEDLPVLVVGLSRKNTPVLDLTELRQIPFPQVMGGKGGKDSKKLHQFLANQIAHGVAVADIELDEDSQEVVRAQARKHVQDISNELHQVLSRIEGCQDAPLRNSLFEIVAVQFKLFEQQAQGLNTATSKAVKAPKKRAAPRSDESSAQGLPSQATAKAEPALPAARARTVLTLLTSAQAPDGAEGVPQASAQAADLTVRAAEKPIARKALTPQEKNAQLRARWEQACAQRRYHAPVVNAMQAAFLKAA